MSKVIIQLKRRITYLKRAKAVREAYREYKETELTDVKIHAKYIYPRFLISKRTFDTYISMNAAKMLVEVEAELDAELNRPIVEVENILQSFINSKK